MSKFAHLTIDFNQYPIILNICIDIGNTNSKLGFFDGEELVREVPGVSDRGIVKTVNQEKPEHIMIGSVRKGVGKLVEKCRKVATTMVLEHTTALPLKSTYSSPETLGMDRIAAAVGAAGMFKEKNNLVVDIGTCITYDLVDRDNMYHGGGISPGVDMRLQAMHKFTSGLPLVAAKGKPELIGKTTRECMLSGVVHGTTAELEGIILRYRQFFDPLNIIFCGGGAIFFESKIKDHIFAVPNLVLVGLNHILRYNLNV